MSTNDLQEIASTIGFDACGAAKAEYLDEDAAVLRRWLDLHHNGSMQYMENNFQKRVNPQQLVPGCQTVIVCLLNYYTGEQQLNNAPYIAQSGLSAEDYHQVMKQYLTLLEKQITEKLGQQAFSQTHQHLFCDSAPVLERRWASRAGLGWIGKNKQFINPKTGSFCHIGILLMNSELSSYSVPYDDNPCQDCDLCIKACPTGALRGEMFDARKCISYLTIERKEPLDAKYKKAVETVLYGCDTCAKVCPFNQHLTPTHISGLKADNKLLEMTQADWNNTSRRQKLKLLRRLAPNK